MEIPAPELYYELLPVHFVKVGARRGVKVGGLWYGAHSPALDPCRGVRPPRGGRHAGKWAVRRDPRDCRQVFIELDGTWHPLSWNGPPPQGTVPAFGDARVGEVLKEAARSGLRPRTDTELLPVLLDLLAEVTPVEGWPGRPDARKLAVARARARSRPGGRGGPPRRPAACGTRRTSAPGREVADAITADRLRRRRAATGGAPPVPAARLGGGLAARTLYPTARPEPHADLDERERPDSDHAESIEPEDGTG